MIEMLLENFKHERNVFTYTFSYLRSDNVKHSPWQHHHRIRMRLSLQCEYQKLSSSNLQARHRDRQCELVGASLKDSRSQQLGSNSFVNK